MSAREAFGCVCYFLRCSLLASVKSHFHSEDIFQHTVAVTLLLTSEHWGPGFHQESQK